MRRKPSYHLIAAKTLAHHREGNASVRVSIGTKSQSLYLMMIIVPRIPFGATRNYLTDWPELILDMWLFVQNQVQQLSVNLDMTVVLNKTQFPKSVHEEVDAGPRRSDHLS
jgi:hypothetical protein